MVIVRITNEACLVRDVDTTHNDVSSVAWKDIYLLQALPCVRMTHYLYSCSSPSSQ
jgi:hypothetical protein